MKRFYAIICLLLLVFVLFSCKNLTLTEKNRNTGKGTVYIRIPASRAPIVQTPGDVTKYLIQLYLENKAEPVFTQEYTSAELNKGVTIDLDPNDYKVHIDASDTKGLLFTGETASLVHVTLENTADNPAVAVVSMKRVLVCYETGSEAIEPRVWYKYQEGNTIPSSLSSVLSDLPEGNRTAANGYVITGWKDSNNGNQIYDAEEPIDLDGKKLPLRLTAVWGEPVIAPTTGYASSFADTRFYQSSDVQGTSSLDAAKAFSFTVSGNQSSGYCKSVGESLYLKLGDISVSESSVTAYLDQYTSESAPANRLGASGTITAVTQYGVVLTINNTDYFLFTGNGLNHYSSLTADEASGYRMNSAMIINAPESEEAINEALDGVVSLRTADDVLALMNNSSDDKYSKRYFVEKNITITELAKSLFEKQFNGTFDGQGHTITVGTGSAPLFKDIGASGEVCNLTLKGNFSTYTEPYRDFGVLCSNNYGKLHDCSFEGTAPTATSSSAGTIGVFGYWAPGSTSENNSIVSGTVPSDARLDSTMYQITMIPITGATISTSIGAGAFASASTTSVTVGDFLIAEAEVTYKQWREVYEWATNNGYTFSSDTSVGRPGDKGSDGETPNVDTVTVPVTNISYSDILVWCNAASEKQGLAPVYYVNGTTGAGFQNSSNVLRNATTSISIAATSNSAANGYRLPEQKEWEYAARGGNPDDTTAWNYPYAGTTDPQGYAVQYNLKDANGNTCSQILGVKNLKPNTTGLYDMSGNAGEYFYPMGSGSSCYHSSSRNTPKNSITVDYKTSTTTRGIYDGFRVVRSIVN